VHDAGFAKSNLTFQSHVNLALVLLIMIISLLELFASVRLLKTFDSEDSVHYTIHLLTWTYTDFILDLLFESHTEKFVKEEVVAYVGPSHHIDLFLLHDRESGKVVPLTVEVRRYSPEGSEDELPYHTVAVDDSNFRDVPSDRYAIIPESIPSVDDILDWVQMDLSAAEGVAVQRLIIALARFMTEYCDRELQLPCSELLASTAKILKLLRCWRSAKMVASGGGTYASKAIASQILLVVKKGIWEQEQFVLKKLESLIYKTQVPDRKSLVPLWACLWSLILMYRDCMKVYKQYSAAPRETEGKRKPGTVCMFFRPKETKLF
jgi:hypothetical protein